MNSDVWRQVFERLPLADRARCKAVCPAWRAEVRSLEAARPDLDPAALAQTRAGRAALLLALADELTAHLRRARGRMRLRRARSVADRIQIEARAWWARAAAVARAAPELGMRTERRGDQVTVILHDSYHLSVFVRGFDGVAHVLGPGVDARVSAAGVQMAEVPAYADLGYVLDYVRALAAWAGRRVPAGVLQRRLRALEPRAREREYRAALQSGVFLPLSPDLAQSLSLV